MNLELRFHNDINYNPSSADNFRKYNYIYYDENYSEYIHSTKHGIEVFSNDELINSALLISHGGGTGIHETCSIIENNLLFICCASSVFCLTLPELVLRWRTTADSATCFEIVKYKNDLIIHGELEITKLDKEGNIIWGFSGNDVFTTPIGKNTFKIVDDVICATNWENATFELDANTGQVLRL